MPKLYIAQQTSPVAAVGEARPLLASGSLTIIKKRIAEHKETEWNVKTVTIKTDVQSIIALVENPASVFADTDSSEDFRINASGQVRTPKG